MSYNGGREKWRGTAHARVVEWDVDEEKRKRERGSEGKIYPGRYTHHDPLPPCATWVDSAAQDL